MSKERLTYRNFIKGEAYLKYGLAAKWEKIPRYDILNNAIQKLAEYEDLEEQGLLLRLPVTVGDTVYSFSFGKVFCAEVIEIKYICEEENYGKFIRQKITIDGEECGITIIDFSDIGKRYFLTQSEAEEKLRELEGK